MLRATICPARSSCPEPGWPRRKGEGCPGPEGGKRSLRRDWAVSRRSGRDPTSGRRSETRLAEGGGRSPGSPKGGAGAGTAGRRPHARSRRRLPPARPTRARLSVARAPRVPERGPDAGRVGALDLSQDPLVLRSCLQALRLRHLTPIHRMGEPGRVSPSSDQLTFRSHSHPKLQSLPSLWLPAGRPRPQARHAPFVTASADIPRNAFWDL